MHKVDEISTPVNNTALNVEDLSVTYSTENGSINVLRNVSLKIAPGEIYGLVGESGSGKTTLARAIVNYLPPNARITSGTVNLNSMEISGMSHSKMRCIWGSQITMVHQDPFNALNPAMQIGDQFREVLITHLGMTKADAESRSVEMLKKVHIPDPEYVMKRYAHQLSGGMLQRVLIAAALSTNPKLLIMDEPTTALDVTIQVVILDLLHEILSEFDVAVLYITHNLGVVARICDKVGIIYAGQIMEEGKTLSIFNNSFHPYTRGLINSVPRISENKKAISLDTIPGSIPKYGHLPKGCKFEPRCKLALGKCSLTPPPLLEVEKDHFTSCYLWNQLPEHISWNNNSQQGIQTRNYAKRQSLLEVNNITKHFRLASGFLPWYNYTLKAVDDISLKIPRGCTLGIVGESGCGKTTLARCIVGLESATSGDVNIEGDNVPYLVSKRKLATLRKVQMVFQNPDASLNPKMKVGDSVARPLILLHGASRENIKDHVENLLELVSLPKDYFHRYPHELSGGEKQRVAIARALAADPKLIVLDEPISSLDVSVQAAIMNLLADLQRSQEIAYLFISHDLSAVRHFSDWIAVMYLGRLWEVGPADEVFVPPFHPYTEALLSAIPVLDPTVKQKQIRLEGAVPSPLNVPKGCRFHTRCPRKIGAICECEEPPWQYDSKTDVNIRCHMTTSELREIQIR